MQNVARKTIRMVMKIARVAALLLAVCAAGGAWAAGFKMTNPVTGEEETYTYKFVGTTHIWNGKQYWQDSNGDNPSAVPGVTDSNLWAPILFDASVNSINITAGLKVEGWNLRMGLYNGAKVTLNNLQKLQSNNTPMWITVDGTSQCTIGHMANAKLVNSSPLSLYSAKTGGIAWSEALSDSSNGNGASMPFHYYLTGTGSVAFNAGISVTGNGAHVIKQADVTLTGTSQVSSKTLVSFTSSTKTFTADAAIKVYDTDGTTLKKLVGVTAVRQSGANIENTVSQLTTANAVGSCEIVQCTNGIVLYYVDGDPSAAGYKPSININFTNGNGLTTVGEVGLSGYAVPGMSWNNFTIPNNNTEQTFSTVAAIDSTGVASTASGVSVTVSGHRGVYYCSDLNAGSNPLHGYVDEGGETDSNTATPTVTITGIPYANYRLIVYHSTDSNNLPFGYDTINGTDFTYVDGVQAIGTTSWGNSGASNSANPIAEGVNTLVSGILTGSTATMVAHRVGTATSASVRGCFAAIQVVEVVVSDTELVIPVTGATTYTVDADKEYEKVIISGTGTLTLDGTGTITTEVLEIENNSAIVMNSSRLAATAVIGKGTAIYDGEVPPADKGWTDSANWTGTVWIKNYGTGGDTTTVGVIGTNSGNAANNVMNNWGNANSSVKFTNVRGWCDTGTLAWTLILEDDATNYAWYNNNGYSGRKTTFGALKGTGTFYDVGNTKCRQLITFTEASGFTGVFHVTGKRIGLGGDNTAADNETEGSGTIEIVSTASATIASGKTWTTGVGGFRIKGTLAYSTDNAITTAVTGSGTLVRTGITNHGNVTAPPTALGLTDSTKWTGVFEFRDCSMGVWSAKNFGNAESTVRLNGTTSYFQTDLDNAPHAVKCIDIGSGGWTVDGSYASGAFYVPAKLTGAGSFNMNTSGDGNRNFYFRGDASEFAGVIVVNGTNNRVVVGSTPTERTFAAGSLVVAGGGVLTVSSSTQWNPVGGLFVDEGGVITLNGGALWTTAGITVDGTLKASGRSRWGGGTPMVINDTGILELTSTSSVDESNSTDCDYANVTGTGTIKFNGTGYRGFPYTSPADTLSIVAEQAEGVVFRQNNKVIGSLSGTKNLRSDLGDSNKTLTIKQAKDGVWRGIFKGGGDRLATIVVAPGDSTTGTLTLAGTQDQDGWTDALTVSGSVNLTGTWQGDTTVSGTFGGTGTLTGNLTFNAGATFKAFASDENGLAVSGTVTCPTEGKVTVDVSALTETTGKVVLMTAANATLDAAKFALASGQSGELLVEEGNALKVDLPMYAASYGGTKYPTIQEAINAAVQAGQTYADVTILNPNATCPDGYYVDTENGNALAKYAAAAVTVGVTTTTQWFTTFQAAIDAAVADNQTTYAVAYADGSATAASLVAPAFMLKSNGYNVSVTCSVAGYGAYAQGQEIHGFAGVYPYSASPAAATFTWTGAENNGLWETGGNWSSTDGTVNVGPAKSLYTVVLNTAATIALSGTVDIGTVNVGAAVTVQNSGAQHAVLNASSIVLTAAGASIAASGVSGHKITFAVTPTSGVPGYIVQSSTSNGTTTYSLTEQITVDDAEVGYMDNTTAVITNTAAAVTVPASAQAVELAFSTGSEITLTSTTTLTTDNVTVYATDADGQKTSTDISSAFKVTAGANNTYTISLYGSATVGGVKVQPETAEDSPMTFTGSSPSFTVKTIPGLWYQVLAADSVDNGALVSPVGGTAVQATTSTVSPVAPAFTGTVKFYKIAVGASKAALEQP